MLRKAMIVIGIIFLIFSFTAEAQEKKNVKAQLPICKKVASMIKDGTIKKYVPPRENCKDEVDLRCTEYLNLDINSDGIVDKVIYSSGSGESFLQVKLSNGRDYDHEESGSMLIVKIRGSVYALVTYWESGTIGLGRIIGRFYKLTQNSAEKVCDLKEDK